MSSDIDKWLTERERQTSQELAQLEQEVVKQRAVLESIRRWRAEVASTTGSSVSTAPTAVAQAAPPSRDAPRGDSGFESMPEFDEASDPTGKRKAIWGFLDDRRGRPYRNGDLHRELIATGAITPDTPAKHIEITTRRMLKANPPQLAKAGRGLFWLPPNDNPQTRLEGGDD